MSEEKLQKMDRYQKNLYDFLCNYADNAAMSEQDALRDILWDLRTVAEAADLNFFKALLSEE